MILTLSKKAKVWHEVRVNRPNVHGEVSGSTKLVFGFCAVSKLFPQYLLFIRNRITEHRARQTIVAWIVNILNPTGHVMHHQFNIQQL